MSSEIHIRITHKHFLIAAFLLSCLVHSLVLLFNDWPDFMLYLKARPAQEPLKVTTIDREEWERLRTVGKKDGEKLFSMPVSPKSRQMGKTPKQGDGVDKNGMDFKDLQVTGKAGVNVKPVNIQKNADEIKTKSRGTVVVREEMPHAELKKIEHQAFSQQRPVRLSRAQISNMPIAIQDAMLLENTDFNVGITPPEGVDMDQLNSMEKMYYSFQKRTFESYVNAFLTSYQKVLVQRPLLKNSLGNNAHQMTGRVVFDQNGNIISIKIIKSSMSDDVHELFEQTLLNIRKLPNPPKALLSPEGEFTIYYQLNIN